MEAPWPTARRRDGLAKSKVSRRVGLPSHAGLLSSERSHGYLAFTLRLRFFHQRFFFLTGFFTCRGAPSSQPFKPDFTAKFFIALNKPRALIAGVTAFQSWERSASVRSKQGWDYWPPGAYARLSKRLCGPQSPIRTRLTRAELPTTYIAASDERMK